MSAFAELEKELIKERTQVGLSSARGRGKLGGRPTIHANDKKEIAYQMVMENNQKLERGYCYLYKLINAFFTFFGLIIPIVYARK